MRRDQILRDLSQKKLELLEKLCIQSQLWLLNGSHQAYLDKQTLLDDIQRNDQALELREGQLGSLAKDLESAVYTKVRERLEQLGELNQQGQQLLQAEREDLEDQRQALLSGGARMTGYVKSSGPYTDARRLKGAALKKGWQRGYRAAP